MNKIIIDSPKVNKGVIEYSYGVSGEWSKLFFTDHKNYIEYSEDVSNVPPSILIIPFLANIIPVAWVCDAEIIVEECDVDFFNCIDSVKKGYIDMFPMINFKGNIVANNLVNNTNDNKEGAIAFFSGGVDAFNTLVNHAHERPTLVTLLGADLTLDDEEGWLKVLNHIETTCEEFETDYVTVKSTFRSIYDQHILTDIIKVSKDNWWHGFQHGIGIISHSAPIAYLKNKKDIYFASSFTLADKGKVTCASDPTIDNNIKFCGCNVIHDGYEFTRQMKIHNITSFSNHERKDISLRVCWESSGGTNCCNCEKCFRTILGIYAEGYDPHNFGFNYDNNQLKKIANTLRYGGNKMFSSLRYKPIQSAMKNNIKKRDLPKEIRWFYSIDINRLGQPTASIKLKRKFIHMYAIFLRKR